MTAKEQEMRDKDEQQTVHTETFAKTEASEAGKGSADSAHGSDDGQAQDTVKEKTDSSGEPDKNLQNEAEAGEAAGDTDKAADSTGTGAQNPPSDEDKTADNAADGADKAENASKPDAKDQKIEELTDKYKRLFAEFDNFRKRSEAEKASMFGEGERTVLLKVLELVDNFERAQQNVPEELKGSAYVEGMDKIYRLLMNSLKELGVSPIEAVGTPFDANLHNAVMHVEDETVGESVVAEEFQKGYLFKDKVLRHAMVKVAN